MAGVRQLKHFRVEYVLGDKWRRLEGRAPGAGNDRYHLFAITEQGRAYLEWRLRLHESHHRPTIFGTMAMLGILGYAMADGQEMMELAIRFPKGQLSDFQPELDHAEKIGEFELPEIPPPPG